MKLTRKTRAMSLLIDGDIFNADSVLYAEAKTIWNSDISRHPTLIVRPKHPTDLSKILDYAMANDYQISIKNGGHGAAGNALIDQGIVIDMHHFNGYEIDHTNNTIRLQGGLRSKDAIDILCRETNNMSFPIGTCPFVGISGLTLGGGIGFLSKRHGLACDNVKDFTLLTGEKKLITVSNEQNLELFKALKGAGHCNYGIVTDINYHLHPIPANVIGGTVAFDPQYGKEILVRYVELIQSDDDDLFVYCSINNDINEQLTIQIYGLYLGNHTVGQRIFAYIAKWAPAIYNDVKIQPYHVMQGSYEEHVPEYPHLKWKSGFVKPQLSADFYEVVLEMYQSRPNQHCRCHFDPLGGQIARVDMESSSFINRQSPFLLSILAIWYDTKQRDACTEWARKMHRAVSPYFATLGHANYDDADFDERGIAYFGSIEPQLQQLKSIHDPFNIFKGSLSRSAL